MNLKSVKYKKAEIPRLQRSQKPIHKEAILDSLQNIFHIKFIMFSGFSLPLANLPKLFQQICPKSVSRFAKEIILLEG